MAGEQAGGGTKRESDERGEERREKEERKKREDREDRENTPRATAHDGRLPTRRAQSPPITAGG
jgi:hypothetical protein